MTASPYRPRSQNTATSPNLERLRPANGSSRVDDSHLRTLPPTLFRLRNLNVPRSAVVASVAYESETSPVESDYQPSADPQAAIEATPAETENLSTEDLSQNVIREKEARETEAQGGASQTLTQWSLVSQLSSQSLVLFVILAIAVTGIVIGNRGGEQVTETENALTESLLADTGPIEVDLGITTDLVEAASISEQASVDQYAGPSGPALTDHADLGSTASGSPLMGSMSIGGASIGGASTDESLDPNTLDPNTLDSNLIVQTQDSNIAGVPSSPSEVEASTSDLVVPVDDVIASAAVPPNAPQDSMMSGDVQGPGQPNELYPAQVSLGAPRSLASGTVTVPTTPGASGNGALGNEAQVANVVSVTGTPATRTSSGYVQTQTPAGVNDWLRYLPSVNVEASQPGTVAVSETPLSPVASYQQYLDSISPGGGQVAAPVGYLQDSYQADPAGTQAQLPVSTSSTQRR